MEFASKYGYNYGHQGSDCDELSDEDSETKQKVKRRIRKADSNVISLRFDRLVLPNEMFAGEPIKCTKCQAIISSLSKVDNVKSDDQSSAKRIWECEFCYEKNDVTKLLSAGLDEVPKVSDVTYLIEKAPAKSREEPEKEGEGPISEDDSLLTYCIDVSGSMDTAIQVKEPPPADQGSGTGEPASASVSLSRDTDMTRLEGVKAACIENISHLKSSEPNKRVSLTTFSDEVKFYGDGAGSNQPLKTIGGGGFSFQPSYGQPSYGQPSYGQPSYGQYNNTFAPQMQQQQCYVQQTSFQKLSISDEEIEAAVQPIVQEPSTSDEEIGAAVQPIVQELSIPEEQIEPAVQEVAQETTENYLNDKEKLMALAKSLDVVLKPIKESSSNLEFRIKHLRTEGSTALGPALVFSIGFSSKQPGSQVILCTDGCANVGMGTIEFGDTNQTEAEKFYEDLADEAKSNGVTVNVISMEGTDCKLALLGKVADRSNGVLSIVNPAKLGEQFKSILENRIVATNVQVKLIVNNKYLYVRDEELEVAEGKAVEKNDLAAKEALEATKKSVIDKNIGNANIDTEITFEYGVRKLKDGDADSKQQLFKELPFQLQIAYTTHDGAKAMRVYTKVQEFTKDRKQAEQCVESHDLLFANSAQKMSHHVESNNVFMAKFRSKQMQQQQLENQWSAPSGYQRAEMVVGKLSKSARMEDLADEDAEQIYSSKKASRNKMKN